MLDPKIFEELSARMSAMLAKSPAADIEKNIRALLSGFLNRLDLVTRDEFDIQTEVLRRTRERLEALEKRFDEREKNAQTPEAPAADSGA